MSLSALDMTILFYPQQENHKKEVRQYRDYDQHNNWQTEIKIKDNKIISIRKRQIIYY